MVLKILLFILVTCAPKVILQSKIITNFFKFLHGCICVSSTFKHQSDGNIDNKPLLPTIIH